MTAHLPSASMSSILHGVPSSNNNIISRYYQAASADDSDTRNAETEMRGKSSGTQSNTYASKVRKAHRIDEDLERRICFLFPYDSVLRSTR